MTELPRDRATQSDAPITRSRPVRGFTAVLRIKNEAGNLPVVLPPLLRAVRRVKIVDNGSTDDSIEVARAVASDLDAQSRVTIESYPHEVARCGPDHLATDPASVHSLARFYQQAFSGLDTTWALKWDGDMLLTREGESVLRQLEWRLTGTDWILRMPRHSVYVEPDGSAWVDAEFENCEFWGWPNHARFAFGKAFDWEILVFPKDARQIKLPEGMCFEIKRIGHDEFSHWSSDDFSASRRTRRKLYEQTVFESLRADRAPGGLLRFPLEGGTAALDHLVDVRTVEWEGLVSGLSRSGSDTGNSGRETS